MKSVTGFEDCYIIYSNGKLWSIRRNIFIKPNIDKDGYYLYHLRKNGKRKVFKAHRLVANHFIPNTRNLPEVNHKDGNKINNDISNLEWCDDSSNMDHAVKLGLVASGSKIGNSKLKEKDISVIRERRGNGESLKSIAQDYNVTFQLISKVCKGYIWKSI